MMWFAAVKYHRRTLETADVDVLQRLVDYQIEATHSHDRIILHVYMPALPSGWAV